MKTIAHAKPVLFVCFIMSVLISMNGCLSITCGCEDESGDIVLTPLSGRFGYAFSDGPYGLSGTLTKENLTDANWHLEGTFTFPTTGYVADEPEVLIAESYPEQVSITLHVHPPAAGTIVAQVVTQTEISADIPASNEAAFTMTCSQ